jgi:phosphoglycerol transferase MdoB-like AlkP superfamily enzyme
MLTSFLTKLDRTLFPGRLRALRAVLAGFVLFNAAVRIALALYERDVSLLAPWRLVPALLIGLVFDAGVATFFLAPLALLLWAWPSRLEGGVRHLVTVLLLPVAGLWAFVGAAELVFWNEFSSRFNFIAVDYLVYTNEVVGNIRESYNLPLALSGIAAVALVVWALVARAARRSLAAPAATPFRRTAVLAWTVLAAAAYLGLDPRLMEFSRDGRANELAGNGYFSFGSAFWRNEIDYDRFYKTLPAEQAAAALAGGLAPAPPEGSLRPYEREVRGEGPERKLNVVLVSVESLSAEFLGVFGGQGGLTPNLDRIAREGLLFTHVYATGTRTVRGLEALSLSVPPTPGHSIVKRPDNAGLFTVGDVFREKGYEPLFLYGGYGYFDNMNAFFGGNGYTVVDRTALRADQIHYENIWGVADEDLFDLAVRELDRRYAEGKRFFAHVMTTSNHRPYTYPEGRIDIPSHSGRHGGVKYTDWAIGHLLEEARRRPWFDDTVFVIVADHTHRARGRTDLPVENYHIPLIVWSPRHVKPGRVDTIASQIDVAPTLLGMLGFSYRSRFFGHDILRDGAAHPRALMANYQTVGLYQDGLVVELKPNRRWRLVDAASGEERKLDERGGKLLAEAIGYYQVAADAYARGELKVKLANAEVLPPPGGKTERETSSSRMPIH